MDPRSKALLFLLDEVVKKHPSSASAGIARGLMSDIQKVETTPMKDPLPMQPRVPVATSEPRPRDEGEQTGVTGPGVEADLV